MSPVPSWEEHQHPEDQVTSVVEGEIDFVVAGEPVHLKAGELAALPGGVAPLGTGRRAPGPHAQRLHVTPDPVRARGLAR